MAFKGLIPLPAKSAVHWIPLVLAVGFVTGCATNPFAKSYQPSPTLAQYAQLLKPYSGQTQVVQSSNLGNDESRLVREGYALLGISFFQRAGHVPQELLEEQGRAVGADMVLAASVNRGAGQPPAPPVPIQTDYSTRINWGSTGSTVNADTYKGGSGFNNGGTFGASYFAASPDKLSSGEDALHWEGYAYAASYWRKAAPQKKS